MIETPRLLLRVWRDSDREPFARLNADPRVMHYFPACLTREESDTMVDKIIHHQDRYGFSLLAAELKSSGDFIGFVGLLRQAFPAYFSPCVEIGWRLAAEHWNQGYATEGAHAVLHLAFGPLGLSDVVSFTAAGNLPSRRVMEKLGMRLDGEFDHPRIPEGHPLRRHVLYRLRAADYETPGAGSA